MLYTVCVIKKCVFPVRRPAGLRKRGVRSVYAVNSHTLPFLSVFSCLRSVHFPYRSFFCARVRRSRVVQTVESMCDFVTEIERELDFQ